MNSLILCSILFSVLINGLSMTPALACKRSDNYWFQSISKCITYDSIIPYNLCYSKGTWQWTIKELGDWRYPDVYNGTCGVSVVKTDCIILNKVWNKLGGAAGIYSDTECCGINGVRCDNRNLTVTMINWGKSVSGKLPMEFKELVNLKHVDFTNTGLKGVFPSFPKLTYCHLSNGLCNNGSRVCKGGYKCA
jgi:hypothetical protein